VASYRADIEIGVKGLRQVDALKTKVEELSKTITDLAFKRFAINDSLLRKSAFFVAQEQKLIAARQQYNDGIRESVRLAVQFQSQLERSAAFAAKIRQQSARALPQSSIAGLLTSEATATPFRVSERKAARIDAAYTKLAIAAEGTSSELTRIGTEAQTFKALPAAGQATVNFFQIAETAARAIDAQNATTYRYERALAKLAAAAEGTVSSFVRIQAGTALFAGLLAPANIAGLLPYGLPTGGQKRLPPRRIAGYLPPAGGFTPEMNRQQFFPVGGPIPLNQYGSSRRNSAAAALGQTLRGRAGGAIGNALIGGAFPLLFGQGAGAAAGGAIGGLVGGAFGGVGGFAGSLIGTLLGDIASRGEAVKALAEDIGFSAQQTKQLSDAFKVANTDVEKFTAVIQNIRGLGLEIEDQAKAIQLVTVLTDKYGGSFERTGNAITSALESGKVTQATLNQLTSQGINIQQALADKFDVNRDAILKMAKDGKISVQSLIDTLVDLGNAPGKAAKETQTASQLFQNAIKNLTNVVGPELQRLTELFLNFGATALNALTNVLTRLGEVGRAIENRIAGDTLKNAQQQFRRDSQALKDLYAVPTEKRTQQQVQRITTLEKLQKGRMQVIQSAQPQKQTQLETFTAPSQAAPSGGGKGRNKKERESQVPSLQNELALQNKILEIVTDTGLARLAGNKATEAALQIEQVLEERSAKIAAINLENIPDAEKELKIKIATAEADRQLVEASFARQNAAQDLRVEQQKQIADALSGLDMELLKVQAKTDIEKQAIQFLEIENQLKAQGITLSDADKEAIRGKIAEIQKLTKEQEAANAKLEMEKDLFEGISSTVASTFSGAIDAAVKGTENLGDALKGLAGDLLATIGKMMIMYGIAQALGAAGGSDGVGVFSFLAKGFGFKGARDGAYWPGGFEAFAQGGVVTSPTMGLIGEGGEPEYVIPQSKMSAAMSRYSRGARGESVIPGSGTSAQGSGAATATMEPIDVRYSVERINNVEYVTADQFRAGMAQAAQQGAVQGERRAMRTLTNSAAARGRLGI
jgi:tape measure domain-containing protein